MNSVLGYYAAEIDVIDRSTGHKGMKHLNFPISLLVSFSSKLSRFAFLFTSLRLHKQVNPAPVKKPKTKAKLQSNHGITTRAGTLA